MFGFEFCGKFVHEGEAAVLIEGFGVDFGADSGQQYCEPSNDFLGAGNRKCLLERILQISKRGATPVVGRDG